MGGPARRRSLDLLRRADGSAGGQNGSSALGQLDY